MAARVFATDGDPAFAMEFVNTFDTRYTILGDRSSADPAALIFKNLTKSERASAPVLRALGAPGTDAVEILYIGPDWMQSVTTVRDYMVASRYHRTQ